MPQHELSLLLVVTSVGGQKVQFDGQPREFAARATERVHGQNVDLEQLGELRESDSDAFPHNPLKECAPCSRRPELFQRPETRDHEFDHFRSPTREVTARSQTRLDNLRNGCNWPGLKLGSRTPAVRAERRISPACL